MIVLLLAPSFTAAQTTVSVPSPLQVSEIEFLELGTSLELAKDAHALLRQYGTVLLTDFPLSRDESIDLELERFFVTTPVTRIVAGTQEGDIPVTPPDILLFRGHIAGMVDSSVVLGISARGSYGVIWKNLDGYVLAPQALVQEGEAGVSHAIQKLSDLEVEMPSTDTECGVHSAPVLLPMPTAPEGSEEADGQFRYARIALECDFDFWNQFNNFDLALDYIYVLFSAGSDIYQRDLSVKLTLTYIRIWTTSDDPYSVTGGGCGGLHEFQDYWRAHHSTPGQPGYVERDIAHQLSSRPVGSCGNIGQLCKEYGYSLAGGIHTGSTLAESLLHDTYHAFHEIGHNFGGTHTHCLKDDSGNWIDKCAVESSCNQTQDCSTAPSTLMSYCHNCPGGYNNTRHEYHAKNIALMLNHTPCLRLVRNPCFVDWRNASGTENGTSTYPYNTVKEGIEAVLPGGTVSIANGNYDEQITIWQPMTLDAPGGTATVGE